MKPNPTSAPIAAVHQSVAAVLSPLTLSRSLKITPPARKPMPETTYAAICVGLSCAPTSGVIMMKSDVPVATSAFVRSPAIR